jgi:putative ABC transport system permease protein
MVTDLRQAFRTLTTSKGFSALVIGVLAVGIGANAAIFSVVNGVLLKPLPFTDSARLVAVLDVLRGEEQPDCAFPDYLDWRAQSKTMDGMAAYVGTGATMTGQGEATSLQVATATSDLFALLGPRPLAGRTLTSTDDRKDAEPVVVISEATWEHRFGRRPSIVGESIRLDGKPFTIVGVMPRAFQFPFQAEPVEAWLPIGAVSLISQWMEQRGAHFIHVLGHLAPGVSLEQANAELQTISSRLAATYPKTNTNRVARAVPLQDVIVRDFRLGLIVLLGAVGALLLVACANVANLLLARSTARQREMAIRAAMGAPRGRLIGQLLAESVILALAGGALGAAVATWAVPLLVAASPVEIPRLRDVTIDRGVLAFTALISMVTGVLFGLAPALLSSRANAGDTLRDAGRASSGGRSTRTRQILVVAELALSLVLLVSAGLLMRSLAALQRVDPGFIVDHAVTTELSLPTPRYPDPAAMRAFYRRLVDELKALPGASAGAISTTLPLSGNDLGIGFTVEGRPQPPGMRTSATYFAVSPSYFSAMGIRLVRGRQFSDRDDQQSPNVIVISETFARHFWPNEDPIGKRVTIGYNNTGPREIVGVVGDVKNSELQELPHSEMYTPFLQTPWPFLAVVVRTNGDPAIVSGSLRAALTRLDPEQAVGKTKTITEYVAGAVATPRFTASLIGIFATVSLLLAGFGLFSVMAYSVALRRREFGIRMALGARAADVREMVVSQALRLGVIGLVIGLAGAVAASRLLSTLLFGVSPNDPATFAGVSASLAAVLLLAAYVPARRATRVDPTVALRTD